MARALEDTDGPGLDHMTTAGRETLSSAQTIWTKKRLTRGGLSEAYLAAVVIRKDGTWVGKNHELLTEALCHAAFPNSGSSCLTTSLIVVVVSS